jgi:hypothetical protein
MTRPTLSRAALLTLALLAGCFSWRKNPSDPATLLGTEHPPRHVRLFLANGDRKEVYDPRVENDSVIGTTSLARKAERRAVALADVTRVEVNKFNTGKTIGAVAATGAVALLIAGIAIASSDGWGGGGGGGGGDYASCPQVYSWDGAEWRLDSGTFGGAFMEALELTDFDNLDYPVAREGKVWLRVGNELNETDYVDELALLAVDHPADRTIVPTRDGRALSLSTLMTPVAARDGAGRDALPQVRDYDDWSWESTLRQRDVDDSTQIRDALELSFVRPTGARHATLVLDGHNTTWASLLLTRFIAAHGRDTRAWYDSLARAPETARRMAAGLAREGFLSVAVQTGNRWTPQGLFWEAGPEIVKRQALPLDLSRVSGDTVRVRLESVPSFWLVDRVTIAWGEAETITPRVLPLVSAEDRQEQDVAWQINARDGTRLTLEPDDWAELSYQDGPAPRAGLVRSYLLRSTGFYRIHTPEAGPADTALLNEVASGPGGVSRVAVRHQNRALRWLAPANAGGGQ